MFGKIKNNTDEEKYVQVNGFKATDKDLTAAYNNFQYEIDKQYECKGEIVDCKNGFHLSLNLQDVLHYWNLDGRTRFFNVEALLGLLSLASSAGAKVCGAAVAIEKAFQGGGEKIRGMGVRVESLARIASMTDHSLQFAH